MRLEAWQIEDMQNQVAIEPYVSTNLKVEYDSSSLTMPITIILDN